MSPFDLTLADLSAAQQKALARVAESDVTRLGTRLRPGEAIALRSLLEKDLVTPRPSAFPELRGRGPNAYMLTHAGRCLLKVST